GTGRSGLATRRFTAPLFHRETTEFTGFTATRADSADRFSPLPGRSRCYRSWSTARLCRRIERERRGTPPMEIITIDTPSLGDRSYLVHDGRVAFAVDPQRDIDRVLALLEDRGVRLSHVFETHIHNDYVTGGLALARLTGAAYHVNADDPVGFERTPISDGDVVEVGSMRVRALATPGHTFTHLSYAATADGATPVVFTGGSLLYGSTGR